MRKFLLHHILSALFLTIAAGSVSAQSFSSFILSGRADKLASGDLAFLTPDLEANKIDISLSFGKWMPQYLNYGALQAGGFMALNDRFGIRLDYRNNLFCEIPKIDENGNEKGTFKPGQQRVMAGISMRVASNLILDINAKYLMSDFDDNKSSAFAGDIAVNYVNEGLTLGIKGADIGSKYKFNQSAWSLPMRIQAGGSYSIALQERHAVSMGADLGYILPSEYKAFTAAAGAEYSFDKMIFARAGYHFSSATAPNFASLGLGFAYKGIGLDAAYLIGPVSGAWTATLRASL